MHLLAYNTDSRPCYLTTGLHVPGCLQRSLANETGKVQVANAVVHRLSITELEKGSAGAHATLVAKRPSIGQLPKMLRDQFGVQGTSQSVDVLELNATVRVVLWLNFVALTAQTNLWLLC